jgi:hypothetical protein
MEAIYSSEALILSYQTKMYYNLDYNTNTYTLKMEAIYSSETLIPSYHINRYRNSGNHTIWMFKNWLISKSLSVALQPLWTLATFSVSYSYTQSVGILGRGISLSQGRYLHTEQHKHRINAHRHPCLDWDSNTRSQCSSWRRRFMS